jgi:hypothetical protein
MAVTRVVAAQSGAGRDEHGNRIITIGRPWPGTCWTTFHPEERITLEEIKAVPAVSPAVLAEAAGITLGYYHDAMDWSTKIIEAGLLIGAGADLSQLRYWIGVGRDRRAIPQHAAR